MVNDATHECPVAGCTRTVPNEKLMCWDHWRRVPTGLARMVYAAYRDRDWATLRARQQEAIAVVDAKLQAARS